MIGRIYRIESDLDGKFYIGSTTQTLSRRLNNHRSKSKEECRKNTPLYAHFNECGWEHANIQLLSQHTDITREELLKLERDEIDKWINDPRCVNKTRPLQTPEDKKALDREYGRVRRERMPEEERERVRIWRLNNPDKRKEQTQRYRNKKKPDQDFSANHAAI